jgi:septal ring factor EnvC (AmiA/AmiB activator)
MNRSSRAVLLLCVTLAGLWGCAQGPTVTAQAERIKALETKVARLEADSRAAAAARDQLRRQFEQSEEQVKKLQATLHDRITERDQVAAQYDTFRKSLRDLVGQAESTALRFPTGDPVTITAAKRSSEITPQP